MKYLSRKKYTRERRVKRVRSRIRGSAECPRLTVFRSGRHVYAQLIDDTTGVTLVSANDSKFEPVKKKVSKAEVGSLLLRASLVGKTIAEIAGKHRITRVVFDRGGYAYHGAVKAVAEGAREGGLQF